MKIKEVIEKLNLEIKTKAADLDGEVTGGYVSDLLSDVIANGREGNIWITLQIHQNIVAVASLKEISAIVIIGGREPEEETIKKAEEERVLILMSKMSAFELVGKLYAMGLSGTLGDVEVV